jgi:GNAT superfamily N-acetyltransferase
VKKRNIDNLTALWGAMGAERPGAELPAALHVSVSWPHRCWLDWDATSDDLAALAAHADQLPVRGIVPVLPWPVGGSEDLAAGLQAHQFELRATLLAMVMDLQRDCARAVALEAPEVARIKGVREITAWTEVCSKAFGYAIDEAVVQRLAGVPGLQLFLASVDGVPAATALTLQTGDTIGIHQVGVPPAFRGTGLAKRIMAHVMALCVGSGARYATLQASAAGEGIYRKMGFEALFPIHTYRRPQPE